MEKNDSELENLAKTVSKSFRSGYLLACRQLSEYLSEVQQAMDNNDATMRVSDLIDILKRFEEIPPTG